MPEKFEEIGSAQSVKWLGRRGLLRNSAILPVAAVAVAGAGIRPAAAAAPAPSDASTLTGVKAPPSTAVQALEAWVGSLAINAATYAAPIVAMYNLRAAVCFGSKPKAVPNTFWRLEDISTPALSAESGYVSPNVNVVYGFGFADLAAEPVILSAPDSGGLYYMIEIVDMWTNAFAYPAGKIAGYKGGKFALVGPGWQGTLPDGVERIECPTRWIELQPRVHVPNEAGLDKAREVLKAITLEGLAEFTGGTAPAPPVYNYEEPQLNKKVASSHFPFNDPMQFWSIFVAALNENPPPASEVTSVLPQYKYLGIELGKPLNVGKINPAIVAQMKQAATQIAGMALGTMPLAGRLANGWIIPPGNVAAAGADYLSRADVAVFGLTANTVVEAIYYSGVLDGNNEPMTGAKQYTMTIRPDSAYYKPVPPGFWSLTMYDKVTSFSVPNSINRYALGGDDALIKNADGSVTIYMQTESPGADKEANWLPTPPGPFYLILRNYAPVPEVATSLQDIATFQGPPGVMPAA
jgi:hypothetical protein